MSSRLGGLAIACTGKWRELRYSTGSISHWFTHMSRDAFSAVETPDISRRPHPPLVFARVLALQIPPAAAGGWFIPSLPKTRKIPHNPTGGSRWMVHSQPLFHVVERRGRE